MSWMPWRFGRADRTLDLGKDQTSPLPRARGPVAIRVERGLLLVTREGDPEDHVLRAGEALVVPPRGKAVAWALRPALATAREVGPAAPRLRLVGSLPLRARWRWRRS